MPRHTESEKLDCFTKVVTPENIQFEYALAGPFQRFPAYLTDLVIWNACFFAIAFLLSFIGGMLGIVGIGEIAFFLILVLYFFVSWFYAVFFETYYNGRTPGKVIFKLRSISIDGRPINGMQAGLRNILRLADINIMLSAQLLSDDAPNYPIFPTFIIGLVVMFLTTRMQRIGDLAAGTMVISEQSRSTPWNLQPEDVRAFGLAELIPPTFEPSSSMAQTIGLYMENRKKLGISRREEIAGRIAKPLLKKFEMLPNTGFDLFLCALYVKIFLSEQQQAQGLDMMLKSTVRTHHAQPVPFAPAAMPWQPMSTNFPVAPSMQVAMPTPGQLASSASSIPANSIPASSIPASPPVIDAAAQSSTTTTESNSPFDFPDANRR